MLRVTAQPRRARRSSEQNQGGLPLHNVIVSGRRTSVRLEPVMWEALLEIANELRLTVNDLATRIEHRRTLPNRTAAIRSFVVSYYRARATGSELPL